MPQEYYNLKIETIGGGTTTGAGTYLGGTEAPIRAEANEGWSFVKWVGEDIASPTSEFTTILINMNKLAGAVFEEDDPTDPPDEAATISGKVTSAITSEAIEGACVNLQEGTYGRKRFTNDQGNYSFIILRHEQNIDDPDETVRHITVTHPSYLPYISEPLTVIEGGSLTHNVELEPIVEPIVELPVKHPLEMRMMEHGAGSFHYIADPILKIIHEKTHALKVIDHPGTGKKNKIVWDLSLSNYYVLNLGDQTYPGDVPDTLHFEIINYEQMGRVELFVFGLNDETFQFLDFNNEIDFGKSGYNEIVKFTVLLGDSNMGLEVGSKKVYSCVLGMKYNNIQEIIAIKSGIYEG